MPAQALDLVGHQRDERRDDHRERAGLLELGQRRDLVADRLARAGRQDAEDGLTAHGRGDDLLLKRQAVLALRLGAEAGKAEPAAEVLARVVLRSAPSTGWIIAGGIAEPPHERARLGERVAYPGRHHRVTARDGDPGKRVGQRPAVVGGFGEHGADLLDAGFAMQRLADRLLGRAGGWPPLAAHICEDGVEAALVGTGRRQPMIGDEQVR